MVLNPSFTACCFFGVTGMDHVSYSKCHERHHGHQDGPHGAATILEHGEQSSGDGGEQRHAVECGNTDV